MDPHLAGRTARSLEPLHALGYFAPEVEAEGCTVAGAQRLGELGRPLVVAVQTQGAFPDGVFANGRARSA